MKKAKPFFGLLVMVLLAATAKTQCKSPSFDNNDSTCTYIDSWTNNLVEFIKCDKEYKSYFPKIYFDCLKGAPNSLVIANPSNGLLGTTPISGLSISSTQITGLTKSSVGLSNVDNTADADKPLSTATQNALNAKQATLVSGSNIKTINNISMVGPGNVSISGGVTSSSNTPETIGTGTAYALTTTAAKVDFTGAGSSDPVITIPETGTYLIFTNIKIDFLGLTTVLQTANFKLRRTNNTAADLTGAITNVNIGSATLLTATGPDSDMKVVKYTGTAGDVIELWGNRQNGISIVGNINVSEASVLAVRIY